MKLYHFVYITFRLNTPYYYIGVHSTDNLLDGYLGSGYHLKNAINKYGRSNFARYELKFFNTHNEALNYENKIITKNILNDKYCYNIQYGGKGSKDEHTIDTKNKIRLKLYGNTNGKGNRGKCGYKRPEDVKVKISNTLKTLDMGQYVRDRVCSKETRLKMSNTHKRLFTEERRNQYREMFKGSNNPFYGKTHSEATRQKLSKINKDRFSSERERIRTSNQTKLGMQNSVKWRTYVESLKNKQIESPMKGKSNPNLSKSMKYAMHIRWHIKRNIKNERCEFCSNDRF